ncbi:MAG: hydrogenase maturation nickel metallochaperone HypA [Thermodesulfobacteriota bacterium]
MSLALSIVELVTGRAEAAGARTINRIELEVGTLAGVLVDSLRFCFEAAVRNTMAAGAELAIREIAARGSCPACGVEAPMEGLISACPVCGQYLVLGKGRELRVVSMTVDEEG